MKKSLMIGAALALATGSLAQKSKMRDARDYLSDANYKKAITTLNEVVVYEDTKANAEAWYLRGMAYLQAAVDSNSGIAGATDESYSSLMKAIALKPDYPSDINNGLYSNALLAFNKGVAAYGKKDYDAAYTSFAKAASIYNINGGKRFAGDKNFSALAMSAKSNAAYTAVYAKKDDVALPLFLELKAMPANADSNVYAQIIDIYSRQQKATEELAAIEEARKKYPANQNYSKMELNYYQRSGKQDVLISKLETAVAANPADAELQFSLANAYEQLSFPKEKDGKPSAKPANFSEYFGKAESAYAKALEADPKNATYNYNAGVIYYESASAVINEMAKVTGTTPAENKKYEALLTERNKFFEKAQPLFNNAYTELSTKDAKKMSRGDQETFISAMTGLREIYLRNGNNEKANELKAKMDALR